jgi:transposase-like protein
LREEGAIAGFIKRTVKDLEEEEVSISEMARQLGVDRKTIYNWRSKGLI